MSSPYRAAVIGLGRMGHTYDDERVTGGSVNLPNCHTSLLRRLTINPTGRGGGPARGTVFHLRTALGAE